jgi:DNA polymerase-4
MLAHEENRTIAHFDLDCFFVSVECLKNNRLIGKPIAVGGNGERGVVVSCSYEARRFGVKSAMPGKLAKSLCPVLIFVSGDMDSYSKFSREVTEIIAGEVPLFEKSSIDEFYVDMTGMDRFFGCARYTAELRQKIIKKSKLSISYGLASNKLISKVATDEAKPDGQLAIAFGEEKSFLAPLAIEKLPMIG